MRTQETQALTTSNERVDVVRTERGLTISGTRLTLYALMDYLKAGWTVELIQGWLGLSRAQLDAALKYFEANRDEVERESRTVDQQADESRQYWEARLRDHLSVTTPKDRPESTPLRARIAQWKEQLGHS